MARPGARPRPGPGARRLPPRVRPGLRRSSSGASERGAGHHPPPHAPPGDLLHGNPPAGRRRGAGALPAAPGGRGPHRPPGPLPPRAGRPPPGPVRERPESGGILGGSCSRAGAGQYQAMAPTQPESEAPPEDAEQAPPEPLEGQRTRDPGGRLRTPPAGQHRPSADPGAAGHPTGQPEPVAVAKDIVQFASDKGAADILLMDIRKLSIIADYFIICSGDNERQIRAINQGIRDGVEESWGLPPCTASTPSRSRPAGCCWTTGASWCTSSRLRCGSSTAWSDLERGCHAPAHAVTGKG